MHYLKFILPTFSRKTLIPSNLHPQLNSTRWVIKSNRAYSSFLKSKSGMTIQYGKNCSNMFSLRTEFSIELFNFKTQKFRIIQYRTLRTSDPRRLHPIVWILVKPILKLTAVLSGRGFRKWWKDLPKDKKAYFLNVLKANRNKLIVSCIISTSLFVGYYLSHLEETPITHRRRFMAFNALQLKKINEYELKQIMEQLGSHIIPSNHPATIRVRAIVNRILEANKDIDGVDDKDWGVAVIDNSIENAFVLPIGHVFVFTGMLKLCSNDDQLGIILAHEIAHCLQNHGAENVSFTHLLDLISIIIIATIWAVLPSDGISILTHWLYQKSVQILLQLPYSRKIETEADSVGLTLAAKACFDVRESSAFWSKMAILKSTFGGDPNIEFLSTHPNHESRSEYLDSIMDEAIKIRKDCGCPSLKYKDPRLDVDGVSKALELARKQFLEQYPKPVIVIKG